MPDQRLIEIPVLLAARYIFRQNEIVSVDAEPSRATRVWVADADEALLPSCGKNGGVR